MQEGAIFPLFYLPPIEFFAKLKQQQGELFLERFEHFPKQTYRNRASICSPQGKLDLRVPVVKGSKVHTKVKDVRISYDFGWQRLHWLSLQTSYRSSAFFEFYEDDFAPFYDKKYEFLFDYNEALLQVLLKHLKLDISYSYTQSYIKDANGLTDYRETIHPKVASDYHTKPYYQVFEERNGFIPDLSIVDLLFNKGPQSGQFF
ncbi:WbqC family protein [Pedobacter sp. SYSU D00535]|uniref:WbqC family protein n=1 Tax=Pedobacter sp. SYSU D00535 TaxID=2810308 RepID=UPI001A96C88C|nr:WbqC family protein [Pedobacter sp. SYSU D00535]